MCVYERMSVCSRVKFVLALDFDPKVKGRARSKMDIVAVESCKKKGSVHICARVSAVEVSSFP